MSKGSRRRGNRRRRFMKHLVDAFGNQREISYTVENAFEIMGWPVMERSEAVEITKSYALRYLDNNIGLGEAMKASIVLGAKSFWASVDFVRKSRDASNVGPRGCDGKIRPCNIPSGMMRQFSTVSLG
jgi:hypothetical protein